MGNIIIILIYLSEDLAVTQGRSLSSPCYYTPIALPVESVPRHPALRASLPTIGYLQDPTACVLLTVE